MKLLTNHGRVVEPKQWVLIVASFQPGPGSLKSFVRIILSGKLRMRVLLMAERAYDTAAVTGVTV